MSSCRRAVLPLVMIGLFGRSNSASAQTRIAIRAGATGSSALVRDSIIQAFSVRPEIGPSIGFGIETGLDTRYRVGVSLSTTWGHLRRYEAAGSAEVVPLSTWTPAVSLYRILFPSISAGATVGAVIYRADRRASNLFRRGSSPMPLVGLGVRAERPMTNGLRLSLSLQYDVHRFSTPALADAGFSGERPVHRLSASVGVSRGL
ncbi:MAG: hypothetical protein HY700_15550 [Gemmatimonadetes bacterium]|nr:hypothetical protein [Gemmatimonadota bacterium]